MHVPPALQAGVKAAVAIVVGPLRLEFAGVAQSTWNDQSSSAFVAKLITSLGAPAGGALEPSRSDGSSDPWLEPTSKHCCVADCPCNMLARSYAQTSAPRYCVPALLNMLKVV